MIKQQRDIRLLASADPQALMFSWKKSVTNEKNNNSRKGMDQEIGKI
jgi:hypothetical protein